MIHLQEYVRVSSDAVRDLIEAGLLRHDTDQPHRLYTVTPDGRTAIGESYRQGVDYGHGAGDLEESSEHVLAVEVARLYLEQEYVANPESPVSTVVPYFDIDESGNVHIAVEAELINNDIERAVPDDYDKMAEADPDEAI